MSQVSPQTPNFTSTGANNLFKSLKQDWKSAEGQYTCIINLVSLKTIHSQSYNYDIAFISDFSKK